VIDGEIFICVDEVRKNAHRHSSGDFGKELNRVILHGLLHLIGYKDGNSMERKAMREKESFYMQNFN
jgi:rRNA maturation RNase YbeY